MKIKIITVLALLLLSTFSCASLFYSGVYYRVNVEEVINYNQLELNEYSVVHHLYTTIFQKHNFIDQFDTENKAIIIKKFLYNFSYKNPVSLVVFRPGGKDPVFIMVSLTRIAREKTLTVMSNLDPVTGEIIQEKELFSKAFSRMYRIYDGLLVHMTGYGGDNAMDNIFRKTMIEKEAKEEQEEEDAEEEIEEVVLERPRDYQNLAEEYLFDKDPDNDNEIEDLLFEAIDRGDLNTRFISRLTYAKYYLSKKDFDSAEVQIERAAELVDENQEHDFSGFSEPFLYIIEEFAILKMIMDGDV